ncbi:MAG: ATP synthase F1 subunit delta [Acidobacteria bacterium]|nr:MAG: ATP synthase F1 subunit delta [Acidobacteriota bacterium]
MSVQTIARRYATALGEVVAEQGNERVVQQEIDGWASLIETNPQLREVFANPTVPYDQKQTVLEELIARTKVHETTASFLRVLLKNQRLAQLKYVAEKFGQVLDDRSGVVAAKVTTARPIPGEVKSSLKDALASAAGRSVRVSFTIDEAIIGGIVTQVGSTVFDGSVQGQLDRLAGDLVGG